MPTVYREHHSTIPSSVSMVHRCLVRWHFSFPRPRPPRPLSTSTSTSAAASLFPPPHMDLLPLSFQRARLNKIRILCVPLIGSIAARIVDCVPVDNKGGKAGGSGSEAIAARLLRMFGEEALATGAVASQQQQQEGANANGTATTTTRSKLPTTAEENWARGWRGNPLLLFPEGTTSNGSCLLRFKTGVFASGVPVYPVTVKFDVRRFSPAFERCVHFGRVQTRRQKGGGVAGSSTGKKRYFYVFTYPAEARFRAAATRRLATRVHR